MVRDLKQKYGFSDSLIEDVHELYRGIQTGRRKKKPM